MPFDKQNKQSKGRPKGKQNKVNQDAKELFLNILDNESEHIKEAFKVLRKESAYKYLQTILKLSTMVIAKPTETTMQLYQHQHEPFDVRDIFQVG